MTQIGDAIYYRRKALGMTQQQLAEKCKLTVNFVSLVETGNRGVSGKVAEKIAKVLKASWVLVPRSRK